MRRRAAELVSTALTGAIAAGDLPDWAVPARVEVCPPADPAWGHLASDVALEIGRRLRQPPPAVGAVILRHLRAPVGWLAAATIGGPGFLNLELAAGFWQAEVSAACRGTVDARVPEALGIVELASAGDRDGLRSAAAAARVALLARAIASLLGSADRSRRWTVSEGAGEPGLVVACSDPREPRRERLLVGPVETAGAGAGQSLDLVRLLASRSGDRIRFALLATRPDVPVVVDSSVGPERSDDPCLAIRWMRVRIAKLLGQAAVRGLAPGGHEEIPVETGELEVVRTLASYADVVDDAVVRIEPHRLALFAADLAAAFHRYYNRTRIVTDEATVTRGRLALACCAERVVRAALGRVGLAAPVAV